MAKGSTFESFLDKEGTKEEIYASATKRLLAMQLLDAMARQEISKTEMAARMVTSRTQLERLLDPNNNKVQLDTMEKAAEAIGRKIRIEIV